MEVNRGSPTIWSTTLFNVVTIGLFAFSMFTTLVRILVRVWVHRSMGVDDNLAIIATALGACVCAFEHFKNHYNNLYLSAIQGGAPVEAGPSTAGDLTQSDRFDVLNSLFCAVQLAFIKISMLVFYRRLLASKAYRHTVHATGATIIAWSLSFVVARCLSRRPTRAVWHPYDSKYPIEANCLCESLAVVDSVLQAIFDVVLLSMPTSILRKLTVNRKAKLGLSVIYLLGLITLGTTFVRLVRSVQYREMESFLEKRESFFMSSVWSTVEANTALICINLPAMSVLFRWTFQKPGSLVIPARGIVIGYPSRNSPEPSLDKVSLNPSEKAFEVLCTTEFTADVERSSKPVFPQWANEFPHPPNGYF